MGGDVLLTRSFVRRWASSVRAVGHQGVAMAPGKLLLAGIAVVYEYREALSATEGVGNSVSPFERCKASFHAFSEPWMDAVAVEKVEFSGRRGCELFAEFASIFCNPYRAAMVDDFDRQGVEELVSKDDETVAG